MITAKCASDKQFLREECVHCLEIVSCFGFC